MTSSPTASVPNEVDLDVISVVPAPVLERFDHRLVGVLQLHVLADEGDPDGPLGGVGPSAEVLPVGEVGRRRVDPEVIEDEVVHALRAEGERHLVGVVDVARGDDGRLGQRREQGDLAADVAVEPALGAAHDRVRLDADAAQLIDRVLGRLRLQLAGVADVGDERQMEEHRTLRPEVGVELADRLEEGERLDVADRASDLGDHEVDGLRFGDDQDLLLDLVGDVRDDLDGSTEVVAAPLA